MNVKDALVYECYYKDKKEYTLEEAASAWIGILPTERHSTAECLNGETGETHTIHSNILDLLDEETLHTYFYCLSVLLKACKDKKLKYKELGESRAEECEFGVGTDTSLIMVSIENLRKFAKSINQKPPFLFPTKREGKVKRVEKESSPTKNKELPFQHSPDFRSLTWRNQAFTFTSRQAQVIQILYDASQKNTPDVGKDYILEQLDSPSSRLRDAFQNHPAWGTLIIKGKRQGTYRIDL